MGNEKFEKLVDDSTEDLRKKCQESGLMPVLTICLDSTGFQLTVIKDGDLEDDGVIPLLVSALDAAREARNGL